MRIPRLASGSASERVSWMHPALAAAYTGLQQGAEHGSDGTGQGAHFGRGGGSGSGPSRQQVFLGNRVQCRAPAPAAANVPEGHGEGAACRCSDHDAVTTAAAPAAAFWELIAAAVRAACQHGPRCVAHPLHHRRQVNIQRLPPGAVFGPDNVAALTNTCMAGGQRMSGRWLWRARVGLEESWSKGRPAQARPTQWRGCTTGTSATTCGARQAHRHSGGHSQGGPTVSCAAQTPAGVPASRTRCSAPPAQTRRTAGPALPPVQLPQCQCRPG